MISKELLDKYEMTIGIECHVQLSTKTKLFSGVDNDARDKEPNAVVSPVDYALPGMLPVLNKKAVDYAIKAGLAMGSSINLTSRFDRKHYFYPDLPKGYQISQMYQPIIGPGEVFVIDPESKEEKIVRIEHAHLEEDAGKLTHFGGYSLVDLNRAGTPLIEIVSMPDIHSAAVAKAYVVELHRLMTYAGVTNGDLYHGNMRFDVNISVALKGADKLGTRAEVKNLNSFRSVERAAEYEFERQIKLLEQGERIVQETRGWSDAKGKTSSQRSKEEAQDYRYMPDPDIPPVVLTNEIVDEFRDKLPVMPREYRAKWSKLGLDGSVVESILDNQDLAIELTAVMNEAGDSAATKVAHWFTGVLLSEDGANLNRKRISTRDLVELAGMVEDGELSSTAGKDVFVRLFEQDSIGKKPRDIAKEANLIQVNDEGEIEGIIAEVLAIPESAQAVADVKSGEMKAIGFLVGQVMKKSQGKANPATVNKIIQDKLR
jgi:aspartyl/glutamyl-tRNA(Asn/Gln) amidotransferase, B subunit